MTNLYTEEEFVYPNERKNTDKSRLEGDAWSAWKVVTAYVLEYISGELAGHIKQIEITVDEYQQLQMKQMTIAQVLIAHDSF